MKKLLSGVIISALVITAGTVSAFAYHGRQNQTYKLNKATNFVDSNNDGICDNRGTCGNGLYFVDANGDGICDNSGTCGNGSYFVDANGDGICDNLGTCPKDGTGRQLGKHR